MVGEASHLTAATGALAKRTMTRRKEVDERVRASKEKKMSEG